MVVGFNHNFRYKGEIYHVQTEDGGLKSPNIVTLLYKGGNILASKKTSYADICKVERLEQVVEELMKEQHKEMLRRLKDGDFDAIIEGRREARPSGPAPAAAAKSPDKARAAQTPPPPSAAKLPAPTSDAPAGAEKERRDQALETSLDDIILSYLVGEEERDK